MIRFDDPVRSHFGSSRATSRLSACCKTQHRVHGALACGFDPGCFDPGCPSACCRTQHRVRSIVPWLAAPTPVGAKCAQPQCVLQDSTSGAKYCALACGFDSGCPVGAMMTDQLPQEEQIAVDEDGTDLGGVTADADRVLVKKKALPDQLQKAAEVVMELRDVLVYFGCRSTSSNSGVIHHLDQAAQSLVAMAAGRPHKPDRPPRGPNGTEGGSLRQPKPPAYPPPVKPAVHQLIEAQAAPAAAASAPQPEPAKQRSPVLAIASKFGGAPQQQDLQRKQPKPAHPVKPAVIIGAKPPVLKRPRLSSEPLELDGSHRHGPSWTEPPRRDDHMRGPVESVRGLGLQ